MRMNYRTEIKHRKKSTAFVLTISREERTRVLDMVRKYFENESEEFKARVMRWASKDDMTRGLVHYMRIGKLQWRLETYRHFSAKAFTYGTVKKRKTQAP